MIQNAVIRNTRIYVEDHGVFTASILLDFGNAVTLFGGWPFDAPAGKVRRGVAFGAEYLRRVLEVLEVAGWEDLPRTIVRADSEDGIVRRIGHALKEKWFDPRVLAAEYPE